MPGPNIYLRLFSASTNILKNCSLSPRARLSCALPLELSLHPANQSAVPLIRCHLRPNRLPKGVPKRNTSSHDETYFRLWGNPLTIALKVQYDPMCFVFNPVRSNGVTQ